MLGTAPASKVSDVPSNDIILQMISRSVNAVANAYNLAAASVYFAPFAESIAYLVLVFKSANVAIRVKSSPLTSVAT